MYPKESEKNVCPINLNCECVRPGIGLILTHWVELVDEVKAEGNMGASGHVLLAFTVRRRGKLSRVRRACWT